MNLGERKSPACDSDIRGFPWYVEPLSDERTPLADFFNSLLGFFDLDDRLALVRSAIQTGVMRQLDLVALRTDGHARRGDAQFLCAPLVASFP
jgi:hypothetical protein